MLIRVRGLIRPTQYRDAATTASSATTGPVSGQADGDLLIGFTMNSASGQRPIDTAGVTTIANSNSATSSACSGWLLGAAATAITCSGGSATRIQSIAFKGARTIKGAAQSTVTGTGITLPAVKGFKHGGWYFFSMMSETAGISVSVDSAGLGTAKSSATSGASRHLWAAQVHSYAGGSLTMSGSAEWWYVYGIVY